jgi:hypothetical protein
VRCIAKTYWSAASSSCASGCAHVRWMVFLIFLPPPRTLLRSGRAALSMRAPSTLTPPMGPPRPVTPTQISFFRGRRERTVPAIQIFVLDP